MRTIQIPYLPGLANRIIARVGLPIRIIAHPGGRPLRLITPREGRDSRRSTATGVRASHPQPQAPVPPRYQRASLAKLLFIIGGEAGRNRYAAVAEAIPHLLARVLRAEVGAGGPMRERRGPVASQF